MSKAYLYIAQTLDSYIASPDGSIDWLKGELDYGYNDFIKNIDIIIMGRKTYEQVLTFGEYPYTAKQNYVLASHGFTPHDSSIKIISNDFEAFAREISLSDSNVWIVGGAETIKLFTALNLIDEYIIFTVPILLGSGIALFAPTESRINLELREVKKYDDGIVMSRYIRQDS